MLSEALQQALWAAISEAFPDRAAALQREIRRWYWTEHPDARRIDEIGAHEDPDAKFCSFCSRPYVEIPHFIGISARGGSPRFSVEDLSAWGSALAVDETGNPIPSIMLICKWCLAAYADRFDDQLKTSHWLDAETVMAEVARAVTMAGIDEDGEILAELARRRQVVTPRTPKKGRCDYCESDGDVVTTDRGHICTRCLVGAFQAQKEMIERGI